MTRPLRLARERFKPIVQAIDVSGRVPPHDLGAEAAVLSAILLDGSQLDVVAFLSPEHFYAEAHRRIFEAARELAAKCTPIDVATVASWLKDRDWLHAIGGVTMLNRIVDATPAIAHLEAHGRIVAEKAKIRALIDACQQTAAQAYGDYGDPVEFFNAHSSKVEAINVRSQSSGLVQSYDAAASALAFNVKPAVGTGIESLDEVLGGGLFDGELIVVAAYSGVGKTSFAMGVAKHIASAEREGGAIVGAAIFSLEMPKEQLWQRFAASDSNTSMEAVRRNNFGNQWGNYVASMNRIGQMPLWVDDSPANTVAEMTSGVMALQRTFDIPGRRRIGLVVVDYLQLVRGIGDNREGEIASISRGLKGMAKRLRLPVVALSQLRKPGEGAEFKRPQLSQLRESGAIENDSDVIVFAHRPEWVEHKRDPDHRIPEVEPAEIIVAKQRNGRLDTARVAFVGRTTTFREQTHSERDSWSRDQSDDPYQSTKKRRF